MKPTVQAPDAEKLVGQILEERLGDLDETCTVGVGVPTGWSGTPSHVQVAWDGTPFMEWPVTTRPTIRVTVWASSPSEAKRLAAVAQGVLLSHPGGDGVSAIQPGVGVMPARDDDTQAELAWFTVLATVRNVPLGA